MVTALLFVFACVAGGLALWLLLQFRRQSPVAARVVARWGARDPLIILRVMGRKSVAPLVLSWAAMGLAALAVFRVLR